MKCVDLKQRFGDRYRVTYEESYYVERTRRTVEASWLMIIPCRHGHFFPWGDRQLAASVNRHPNIAGELRRLKCAEVVQDGTDGELTATFDVDDFDAVAKIMRPWRRRRLSEVQRQAAVECLRKYWPTKGESVSEAAQRGDRTTRGRDPGHPLV